MAYVTEEQFGEALQALKTIGEKVETLMKAPAEPKEEPQPADHSVSTASAAQMALLNNQVNQLQEELQRQEKEKLRMAKEREYKEIDDFVDSQIRERKIRHADRTAKINLLRSIPATASFSESTAEGRTVVKSSRQLMMESIDSGPQLWSEGEMPYSHDLAADPAAAFQYRQYQELGVDQDSVQLDQKVREFARANGLNPNDPDFQYAEVFDQYTKNYGIAA